MEALLRLCHDFGATVTQAGFAEGFITAAARAHGMHCFGRCSRQVFSSADLQVGDDEEFRGEDAVFQKADDIFAFIGGDSEQDVRFIVFGERLGFDLFFDGDLDDGFDVLKSGDGAGGFPCGKCGEGFREVLQVDAAFVPGVFPGFVCRIDEDRG